MKSIGILLIWIVLILAGIIFSEKLISYFVVKQIPAELIQRESLSSFKSLFDFSLIPKCLPLIILSLIIYLFSIRFKYRYLIFAIVGGLIGFLIPWIQFVSQLTELWITSLKLSSTFGLAYIALPVVVLPTALAGIFAGLSGVLFYSYFNKSGTIECYRSLKSRKTYLVEGIVYLILAVIIQTGFYIWSHPYRLEEKASSVRTSERKLMNYFTKANAESDLRLLSSLASNPKLPVTLLEEIYTSKSTQPASGDKKYYRLYDALAINIKTPGYILSSISKLNNSSINTNLALNPNTTVEILVDLIKQGSVAVKISVAKNPNTPVEALAMLSEEGHFVIRRFVARHKNVTEEILLKLTNDKDERVKSAALEEIKRFQK